MKEPRRALGQFAGHVFISTALFVLIALPALGLDWLLRWLAEQEAGPVVIYGLSGAKYLIFLADLTLFATFTVRTTVDAAREIWGVQSPDTPPAEPPSP